MTQLEIQIAELVKLKGNLALAAKALGISERQLSRMRSENKATKTIRLLLERILSEANGGQELNDG